MPPAPPRLPLAPVMALVGVVALGLGAMRAATFLAASVSFHVALLALLVGTLAALVRRGEPAWVGFALFGWAYLLLAFVPAIEAHTPSLPTTSLVNYLVASFHPIPGPPPPRPAFGARLTRMVSDLSALDFPENFPANSPMRDALTTPEAAVLDGYHAQLKRHQDRVMAFEIQRSCSYQVGQSCLVLAFALIGAFLGRALAIPRRPAPTESMPI